MSDLKSLGYNVWMFQMNAALITRCWWSCELSLIAWKCQQMPNLRWHLIGEVPYSIASFSQFQKGYLWLVHAVTCESTWICGTGEVYILMMFVHGQWEPGVLHNVLYMPPFIFGIYNLFSTASAAQIDIYRGTVQYTRTACQLIHHGELVMEGVLIVSNDLSA